MLSPRGVQQLLARSLSALLLSSNEIILLCARQEKFPTASSKKRSRKSCTNAKNIIRIKHSGAEIVLLLSAGNTLPSTHSWFYGEKS
jgi:hypothetical protein